jgi:hypothetical protein
MQKTVANVSQLLEWILVELGGVAVEIGNHREPVLFLIATKRDFAEDRQYEEK